MWWGLQTLTSVGYGDFPVETIVGKLLAAMTAVCGVLVMALPIPIVVDNFADYYQEQKKIEAQELKDEAKVLPIMQNFAFYCPTIEKADCTLHTS